MLMCGFSSNMQVLPYITEDTLIYFVTHCARVLNLKHSTIKLYLCGIRFKYMQAGIQSPFTDRNNLPRLATILQAIKKTHGSSAKLRQPITYNILTSICTTLRGGVFDTHTDLLLLTVCVVAFFGFLRCGEFTVRDYFDPTINLCVGDVHFHMETAFLKLIHCHMCLWFNSWRCLCILMVFFYSFHGCDLLDSHQCCRWYSYRGSYSETFAPDLTLSDIIDLSLFTWLCLDQPVWF